MIYRNILLLPSSGYEYSPGNIITITEQWIWWVVWGRYGDELYPHQL